MKNEIVAFNDGEIQNKIFTINGSQVMFDRDLAELYGVETKQLKRAVNRNIIRFPRNFMFKITESEYNALKNLRCQIGTSSWGGTRYPPYVFTEQGVAMLASVLKSKIAIKVSIAIINAFIKIRKFNSTNALVFQRLDKIESKLIENKLATDTKLDKVFKAIETVELKPKQGIFFEGQIFDAYVFISDLIRRAENSIFLIDNYIDETVLITLSKRKKNCNAIIYTKQISKKLKRF